MSRIRSAVTVLLLLFLSGCASKESLPPYYGLFIRDNGDFIELEQTEVFGTPRVSDVGNPRLSPDNHPVISIWNPSIQMNRLIMLRLDDRSEISFTLDPVGEETVNLRSQDPLERGTYCLVLQDPLASFLPAWCFRVGQPNPNGDEAGFEEATEPSQANPGASQSSLSTDPEALLELLPSSPTLVRGPSMTRLPATATASSTSSPSAPPTASTPPLYLRIFNYAESEPEDGWIIATFNLFLENASTQEIDITKRYFSQRAYLRTGDFIVHTEEGVTYEFTRPTRNLYIPGPLPAGFRIALASPGAGITTFGFRFAEAAHPTLIEASELSLLNMSLPGAISSEPVFPTDLNNIELHFLDQLSNTVLETNSLRITLTGNCLNGRLEAVFENLDSFNDTDLFGEMNQLDAMPIRHFNMDTGEYTIEDWFGELWPIIYSAGGEGSSQISASLGPAQSSVGWIMDQSFHPNQVIQIAGTFYDSNSCTFE